MAHARARRDQTRPPENMVDLYDYVHQRRPSIRSSRTRRSDDWRPTVLDDWPEHVPISEAELDVIEAHFGPLLDELFGPIH
jgi:hypothetical protein